MKNGSYNCAYLYIWEIQQTCLAVLSVNTTSMTSCFAGKGVFSTTEFMQGDVILVYRGKYGKGPIQNGSNIDYVFYFEHDNEVMW